MSDTTTTECVLWGWAPGWNRNGRCTVPLKLEIGSLRACRAEAKRRASDPGLITATYARGTDPVGLRLRIQEAITGKPADLWPLVADQMQSGK